ncbi:MAG TPA: DMT family transporter, partial [Xanthobacteraceae bacterium]|nr:DMT family transporter [Xanthobacteraceae bacterium]
MTTPADEHVTKQQKPDGSAHLMHRLASNPYLLLALASLFWSGNHIVGRAIAGHVPPIGMSMARWALPVLFLWPLARPHLLRDWPAIRAKAGLLLFLGLSGGALFSAGQYVGLQYTSALNVSVLNSLTPVFIVVAAAIIFRDEIAAIQIIGVTVSLVGVVAIISRGDIQTLRALQFNWGDLIVICNMAIFAVYSVCLRLRPQIHWLSFVYVLAVISTVGAAPFVVWETMSGYVFQPTLMTLLSILYTGVFTSFLAYAAWTRGVEIIGANRSGPFLHLIPFYSVILAGAFLGEQLMLYHLLGFAMILAGVWLASRGKSDTTPA